MKPNTRVQSPKLLRVLGLLTITAASVPELPAQVDDATWNVPPRAARQQNPVPRDEGALARGRQLYEKECLACHGPRGRGDGPKAADLTVDPGNLAGRRVQKQPDGTLFWKITEGLQPMPSFRELAERDRWMLVHYLRTLAPAGAAVEPAPQETPPREGEAIPLAQNQQAAESTQAPGVTTGAERPSAPPASAPGGPQGFVSREEYERLLGEHEALKRDVEALKTLLRDGRPGAATNIVSSREEEMRESIQYLEETLGKVQHTAALTAPGTTRNILTGFASAGFARSDGDSRFSAALTPILLWQLSDRLLAEGELELTLQNERTDVDLTRAQLYYLLNDYMTLGAGKFLSPMNFLEDRLHQVGKMPDAPVAIARLLPKSNVGLQLRGGIPIGSTKLDYAVYAANAPGINVRDPARLGLLEFDNFDNLGGDVAVGGRIAFFPIRELQLGYGFQYSELEAAGQETEALLHSVDFNYVRDWRRIRGTINLLAQWAWSDVGSLRYDPDGSLGFGPLTFNNRRDGGYVQLAYRPTMVENEVLKRLEPILRYERFNQNRTPADFRQHRWAIGLNYWLMPSTVFKVAYQFDSRSDDADADALLLQFKTGF